MTAQLTQLSLLEVSARRLMNHDVQSVVIPGSGHYCLEEAPEEVLAALTAFLAPYRDGQATAHNPAPRAAPD